MEVLSNEDSDTLDALYAEYLAALRDVILRIENEEDINLCKHWLEAFNQSSNEQKVARNCLIALLYQQLKTNECLREPFTDMSNIGRDFNAILQDVGIECGASTKRTASESTSTIAPQQIIITPKGSSPSDISVIPKSNYYFKQIDDLNKFILNMKRINEALQSELRILRKEKEILEMKNERKNKEMQKLLNVVKGCSECQFTETDTTKPSSTKEEKKDIYQIYPKIDDEKQTANKFESTCESFSRKVSIDENDIFRSLNILTENLKSIASEENPLDKLFQIHLSPLSCMFEKCPSISFQTKIVIFENNIYSLAFQIAQATKNYYNKQLKISSENFNTNSTETKSSSKAMVSKSSQTKSVSYKCYKSNSDYLRNSYNIKIKYLRKCVLKMQNSREKMVEKYENKLKEQMVQYKIQQRIMKLKLASVTSKIFLRSNYKNQEELFELTNHLEAKYKDIVAEAIDKIRSDI